MKSMNWLILVVGVIVGSLQGLPPAMAGLFKMDFGTPENIDPLEDWNEFETFYFADFDDDIAVWPLTDWSGGGDDDVTLHIMDNLELSDELGVFANGMTANNPTHELEDVVYDGVEVPYQVKDDYLYRDPDTAGTELLFRYDNLDPGQYNVTLFLGRTTDANGQFGKVWVESDPEGHGEPDVENTGDFAATLPDIDIEGHPQTVSVEIKAGEYLWYAHMEDNSGGISGIIIRQTSAGGVAGDFNGDGVLDAGDIDDLTGQSATDANNAAYDLNADSQVDSADVKVWVKDLFKSWVGDANLDGEFNSSDLVAVLSSGTYEVDINAVWSSGDFNGDGRANTSDLVTALADGGYEAGPVAAVRAVPEPLSGTLFAIACGLLAAVRHGGRNRTASGR